jgi:hypothetical protein
MDISAELIERALAKLKSGQTRCDVAAIFVGECSPPDQDGVSWHFVLADPHRAATLVGTVSGSQGEGARMQADEEALEADVERIACSYRRDSRLDDLVAASRLTLMREG